MRSATLSSMYLHFGIFSSRLQFIFVIHSEQLMTSFFFLSCLVFDRKTHTKKKKIHVLQRTATRYYNVQNVGNKSQFTSVFSSPLSTNHTCHSLQKIKNPFEFSFDICCATVCVQIYFGSRVVTHAEIGSNTPRDLYEDKEVQKMDGKLENKSYF